MNEQVNEMYLVSTIQKAINILNLFKEKDKYSFSEMQEVTGYNKSTLFRILYTLEYNDYLTRDKQGRYELGINIFILGNRKTRANQLIKFSEPYLKELALNTGFTVHLGILQKNDVIIVNKIQPDNNIQMVSRIGSSVPPHCTGQGKTLLAFSPREVVERVIRFHGMQQYTPTTITTIEEFFKELENIRDRGYAIDNSEHERNIRCVGVPILDNEGEVVAAMSVSGLITDFPEDLEEVDKMGRELMEVRDKICIKMGYM
ncbi:MAG: IclR family transcriptional regulator, regulon repressor [Halanaerobiales bacterium]|nr:IclR family transcriptional regulator, regulon repressor [Halanaerobiales bacterium]